MAVLLERNMEMGVKLWEKRKFSVPAARVKTCIGSSLFLWIIKPQNIIVATELVYSTIYSRFLRLGDIVIATGKNDPYIPHNSRGVIVGIREPFVKGHTDYIYHVAFEGEDLPIFVKGSHLVWEKSQRIRIGQPVWHRTGEAR